MKPQPLTLAELDLPEEQLQGNLYLRMRATVEALDASRERTRELEEALRGLLRKHAPWMEKGPDGRFVASPQSPEEKAARAALAGVPR